jgi:hypothetical protein
MVLQRIPSNAERELGVPRVDVHKLIQRTEARYEAGYAKVKAEHNAREKAAAVAAATAPGAQEQEQQGEHPTDAPSAPGPSGANGSSAVALVASKQSGVEQAHGSSNGCVPSKQAELSGAAPRSPLAVRNGPIQPA